MRPSFLLAFLLLVFVEFARTGEALNGGDRAGAFIGWHGEISRPARTGFGALNTQRDDDENDHQSTRVKHPSITFETLVMKDHKPKPSHHASSICEISSGQFLVSWFAGQFESKPDVGIYTARYQNGKNNSAIIIRTINWNCTWWLARERSIVWVGW